MDFLKYVLIPGFLILLGFALGYGLKVEQNTRERNVLTINDCRGNHEGTIDSGIDHIEQLLK